MAKRGPEPSITREQIDKICSHLRKHAFRETAYAVVGLTKDTVRNWTRSGVRDIEDGNTETLCAQFVREMETAEIEAEQELIDGIAAGGFEKFMKSCTTNESGGSETWDRPDWKALAWIAERRGARRWGVKKQISAHLEGLRDRILDVAKSALDATNYRKLLEALEEAEIDDGTDDASGEE